MEDLRDAPLNERYTVALYYVVTTITTVGYGDVVPGTQAERVFALF